ncbi:unnamed protein product [Spirodela intermedia]|uniref:Uncharacterized protein n=2 Tax=Spirodela intermedia TaxID=51605 RepID=A0A7I8LC31_SPIIN|nr:unnamed protein product [Spirodela intermedia]CAA6669851.1 unnamed protein product [Spirodela intermedia]CAA7406825.1 unnamed protein product [Spirodela intermedia]
MEMAGNNFPDTNVVFANVLRMLEHELLVDLDEPTLYQKLAAANPGANPEQLEAQFYAVLADYKAVMSGLLPVPNYDSYLIQYQASAMQQQHQWLHFLPRTLPSPAATAESISALIESLKQTLPNRRSTKNVAWSDEEHRLFLLGMDLHGKGDWKSISQYFVLSRTPSQIASHAQKFFKRLKKRQQSVQDITTSNNFSQQPGYILKNVPVNYSFQLPMPVDSMFDVNAPSFFSSH